ncbi:MAG: baseplate hub protein [Alphaproteobacteria bacterium]
MTRQERYLKLTFSEGRENLKESKVFFYLDINSKVTFNTSESVSGAINECQIEISGLRPETIYYLATSSSLWVQERIKTRITIESGYKGTESRIFDGTVTNAVGDISTPDYKVSIQAISYYKTFLEDQVSLSFPGEVPLSQIVAKIADLIEFSFMNSLDEDILVPNYSNENATIFQHISILSNMYRDKINIYVSGPRIYLKQKGKPLTNVPLKILSEKTGMIGSPQPTIEGCIVLMRMNNSIITGQKVQVESIKFPALNGVNYVVQTKFNTGDTKGNNWFTQYRLIREDIYNA